LGEPQNEHSSPAYTEIAAIPSATVTLTSSGETLAAVPWAELQARGAVETPRARLEVADPSRNWVRVNVLDDTTLLGPPTSFFAQVRRLRMAELREGVWARPDNLPRAAAPVDAWKVADSQCEWWRSRPDGEPLVLADRLFEPAIWATRARALTRHLEASTIALDTEHGDRIADAFNVGAAALAHVRADPLLPAELCGPDWPGDSLRHAYREYQVAFAATAQQWFRER